MAIDVRDQLQATLGSIYAVERELGGGGMSRVFVAEETSLGRRVAVKVLPPERSAGILVERFQREIRLTARLSHPHIVPVLNAGQAGDLLYYTMPFIAGESLQERLRREQRLPLEEALRITREVADALDYAHRAGTVHRDIKPGNIMLHEGHALVTDFGIGRAISQATIGDALTHTGLALGTPAYMSPEQGGAEPDVDARSDIYSLGCVLYEMLAGEPPFTGPTAQAVLVRRFYEAVPSVRRVREDVPEFVDAAIQRALAKARGDRFATVIEFARALDAPTPTSGPVSGSRAASSERKSVAVLPFDNLSPDPESEYFSDGMTEDVIAQLSKIRDLKVISRTSVMRYKKTTKPLPEIASELGVASILEGSVRRAGNRLRIVAQLIDAATDEHLWAEKFDRDLTDVFAIQSEIAEEIARALEAKLTPAERERLERKPTEDLEAYNLYLLGKYHYSRLGLDFRKSIEYLEAAVQRDPSFAEAHAALSQAYQYVAAGYWGQRPADYMPAARRSADRALELDPALGEAHAALGIVKWGQHFDWTGAERELRQAIELDPNSASAYQHYAVVLGTSRRFDEAIPVLDRACSLDPASINVCSNAAFILRAAGHHDRARAQIERGIQLDSGSPAAYWVLGLLELDAGRFDEAITALETAVRRAAGAALFKMMLAAGYAAAGRTSTARRILGDLEARERAGEYFWPLGFAMIHAQLGDVECGLARLAQSVDERAGWFWIGIEPTLDPLRADPRFDALLRRVNLGSARRPARGIAAEIADGATPA